MNLDAGWIMASLVVSGIGFVLFSYARKMRRLPQGIAAGILMIFPYFVPTVIPMAIITAAVLALLWLAVRLGW
jgi:hypothetical protein